MILDADILSYALYDKHIAHEYCWKMIKDGIQGKFDVYLTHTTILEAYNVLFWHYKVRPRMKLLKKIKLVAENLKIVPPSIRGIEIALEENIPLGDGILIATAVDNRIPIIVSNDADIIKVAPKYGIFVNNPIPKEIREKMK